MTVAAAIPTPLHELLDDIVDRYRKDNSGDVATYIPELALANPDWFGVSLATTEGTVYEAGDSRQDFTIQSISKPFAYALAVEHLGTDVVREHVGVEPSGDAFNSISLQASSGRPLNPMINAGAIAISCLLYQCLGDNALEKLLERFGRFAGRELTIDEKVFQSERSTGHRNRAIAHLLRNFGVISDPVEEGLDLYFQQCSILVTCRDLAVMAATMGNHGINPVTGVSAMSPRDVDSVLSVMTTCGMYNYAGQWLYDVGVPAKSGVAGGILSVLPGRMGIGTFSPRLDEQGNSVRGIKVCQELSKRFALHLFSSLRTARSVIRSEMTLQFRPSSRVRGPEQTQRLRTLGASAHLLELQGDLHFTAMEVVQRRIWDILPVAKILVLDFAKVDSIDAAGIEEISVLISRFSHEGRQVVFSGLPAGSRVRAELEPESHPAGVFADLDSALEACEESLLSGLPIGQQVETPTVDGLAVESLDVARELDPGERQRFGELLRPHLFDSGHCICKKGDAATEIYFLTRGMVSVRLYNGQAGYQRLAAFSAGSVFGEVAAIDRGTRSADVWTETPVECFSLSLEEYDRLGIEQPTLKIKMLEYLLRTLTTRLRRANDLIGQLAG